MSLRILNQIKNCRYLLKQCELSVNIQKTAISSVVLSRNYNAICYKPKLIPLYYCRNRYDDQKNYRKNTESDSDDDNDSGDEKNDKNVIKIRTQSLRIDLLIKAALGIARNKVEELFYESKIRLNGKKVLKKSIHCNVEDVIDVLKNQSSVNPDHYQIARLEIIDVKTDDEFIYVKMRRYKNLTVDKNDVK